MSVKIPGSLFISFDPFDALLLQLSLQLLTLLRELQLHLVSFQLEKRFTKPSTTGVSPSLL